MDTTNRAGLIAFAEKLMEEVKASSRCCDRFDPGQGVNLDTFVDRYLAKDPKGCAYVEHGYCQFAWSDSMAPFPCVGLDACKKAGMLLGVKL